MFLSLHINIFSLMPLSLQNSSDISEYLLSSISHHHQLEYGIFSKKYFCQPMLIPIIHKNMAMLILNHLYNLIYYSTGLELAMYLKWCMSYILCWNRVGGRLDRWFTGIFMLVSKLLYLFLLINCKYTVQKYSTDWVIECVIICCR